MNLGDMLRKVDSPTSFIFVTIKSFWSLLSFVVNIIDVLHLHDAVFFNSLLFAVNVHMYADCWRKIHSNQYLMKLLMIMLHQLSCYGILEIKLSLPARQGSSDNCRMFNFNPAIYDIVKVRQSDSIIIGM